MLPISKLRTAAREALAYVRAQADVAEAEVFASANTNLTVRINYTSHIPSNGVEEPKSFESFGIGLRVAFHPSATGSTGRSRSGVTTGYGSEPTDLSLDGVRRALDKARAGAVLDPEFVSLPKPQNKRSEPVANTHDPAIMQLNNPGLLKVGWQMLDQGLQVFSTSEDLLNLAGSQQRLPELGLILGGDLVLLQQRMAIASTHMPRVQTDETTMAMSFATAMVESQNSKGSGWSVSNGLADFDGESAAEAARNAINSMGGQRVPSGNHRVILGPQALAEILEWVLLPGLQLDMFHAEASPFMGRLGQQIASEQLNIYDDGAAPGLAGSKAITDEGLPTGRTDLIKAGALTGLMSDYYGFQRILHDPKGKTKLGVEPSKSVDAIIPRNGFRPANGGGRDFNSPPSTTPSNLVVGGSTHSNHRDLLRMVGDGIYIGRIWYTYPVNGITAGDFSGTLIGDSYVIKDGRLSAPVQPNTLRMNDNVLRVINNILGIGSEPRGTVRWASDQITWAPEVAVDDFRLEEISESIETVYQR